MRSITVKPAGEKAESGAVEAIARLDKKTKNLAKRLNPGEVAVIDHEDIDMVSAESLVERKPSVVVNASCSLTGKYPNLGPLIIVASGIRIVDEVGGGVFALLREGDAVRIEGGSVFKGPDLVAAGRVLTVSEIEAQVEESKKNLGKCLGDFAANTMEFLEAEKEILLESIELPGISTDLAGRQVLIVVRGHDYKRDLMALRPYMREIKPVLIGVDGGADALMELGYRPDMIVGDMDSVSDKALRVANELVVHGYRNGKAPGRKRLQELGLEQSSFHYPGTSEDIAMLIAYEKGASLIVMVGGHNSLVDFMDKERKGMASTFLVRLRVGSILVDAKGVSRLYGTRVKGWQLALMVAAALITIIIIIILSEPVRQFFTVLAMRFQVWLMKIQNLI